MATTTPAKKVVAPKVQPVIEIELDESDDIPVRLIGRDYIAHNPKGLLAIKLAKRIGSAGDDLDLLVEEVNAFIRLAFSPEDAAEVSARLEDEGDRLDLKHVMALITAMSKKVTGDTPPT